MTKRVIISGGQSASSMMHELLGSAVHTYPVAFRGLQLPNVKAFRTSYQNYLPAFEQYRLSADERTQIASTLVSGLQDKLVVAHESSQVSLSEHLAVPGVKPVLSMAEAAPFSPWTPSLPYEGRHWQGSDMDTLIDDLLARHWLSGEAARSMRAAVSSSIDAGVDLRGHRIAVIGASAEMAPTAYWLKAGSDVLWIDRVAPPLDWQTGHFPGRLVWPTQPIDLLTEPESALAALMAFADSIPIHIGLYAYAPGAMREVLLTGVMNAIVDALPAGAVETVSMLLSPTTPTALVADDQVASQDWWSKRPAWVSGLRALGQLEPPRYFNHACPVSDSVVAIQGASYQAAQYFGKTIMAEVWQSKARFRVSLVTAPITQTRSLEHPIFAAAFEGAKVLGVETFAPSFSQQAGAIMAMTDWFSYVPAKLLAQRLHGGIHTMPYRLESALTMAAVLGLGRRPQLLTGLLGSNR